MAWIRREFLGPRRRHGHTVGQPESRDRDVQELGLLADRLDQQRPARRQRDGERQAGIAAAAPQIHELRDRRPPKQWQGGETVQDVLPGNRLRRADAAQVDRLVPGKKHPNVVVDRGPRIRRQILAGDGEHALTQHVFVFPGQWRKARNTRRERIADRSRGRLNLPGTPDRAAPGVGFSRTRRP